MISTADWLRALLETCEMDKERLFGFLVNCREELAGASGDGKRGVAHRLLLTYKIGACALWGQNQVITAMHRALVADRSSICEANLHWAQRLYLSNADEVEEFTEQEKTIVEDQILPAVRKVAIERVPQPTAPSNVRRHVQRVGVLLADAALHGQMPLEDLKAWSEPLPSSGELDGVAQA